MYIVYTCAWMIYMYMCISMIVVHELLGQSMIDLHMYMYVYVHVHVHV